ncbi:MAG: MTH1187 family thiamine-binding protein [Melioribacteraceae bacterium]|nr:MTH1187 family thiamine-binding protein [Melioribacteraceae bacterium]
MVLLEFSIFPTDKGESVSIYVSKIIDYIDNSGITYQLTPMGTILEGDWDETMRVVSGCFKIMAEDCARISMSLKVDYRKGNDSRMKSKIEKVEALTDKTLKK